MKLRSARGGFIEIGTERAKRLLATGSWTAFETADNDWTSPGEGADTQETPKDAPALSEGQEEASSRPDVATVRAWAQENNVPVSDKGRVAESVYKQYAEAHKN